MSQPIVSFQNISKAFPGVQALDGVSFEVYAGQTHVLMGENGAGKSTLMKILAGAYVPDSGRVVIQGQEAKLGDPLDAVEHGVSMIYQELTVLDNIDVGRNIMLGQEPATVGGWMQWGGLYQEAQRVIDELELDLNARTPLSRLSIAQRQMVEIARASRRNPRIMVMDEPTSSLGKHEEEVLFKLIERLKARDVAIIDISHRMEEVFRLADTITVLRDGKHIATEPASQFDKNRLIELMVGRHIEDFDVAKNTVGQVVLQADNLSLKDKLHDISLTLRAGEVLGVAGLAGAGQTELAELLFGVTKPDHGSLFVNGQAVKLNSPRDAIQNGIAYVPEDRKGLGLVLLMPVRRNMVLASLHSISTAGLVQVGRMQAVFRQWVERLNIRVASPTQSVENLSGGNQQKVVLAKWLSLNPKVLLLNEPTRGIDVGAKSEVHQLIRELAGQGVAILMISSELPEILLVSDRVMVMRQGRVAGEMPIADANEKNLLELAFAEVATP